MAPENPFDIEWRGIETLCDRMHFRRRDKEKDGGRIDKAPDEPRASNAVDLRPRARHPRRAPARIARGQFVFGHERQARLRPRFMAPEKNLSDDAPA